MTTDTEYVQLDTEKEFSLKESGAASHMAFKTQIDMI